MEKVADSYKQWSIYPYYNTICIYINNLAVGDEQHKQNEIQSEILLQECSHCLDIGIKDF